MFASEARMNQQKSHAAAETLEALALYPCLCLKTVTFANVKVSLKILCSHTSHSQCILASSGTLSVQGKKNMENLVQSQSKSKVSKPVQAN